MLNYFVVKFGLAYIIDLILGDPRWLYHPVIMIGKLISFLEKFSQRTAFPQKTQHPNTSFIMQCPLCADVLCGKSPHTDCTQFWFGAGCIHANCANSCSILQKAYLPLDFFNHSLYNLTYERSFIC